MDFHVLTPAQRRVLAALVVVAALLVVAAPRLLHRGDVAGAVRRPGLYRLQQGARISDALQLAGGFARHADRVSVNLAAPVADGEEIVVPARGAGSAAASSGAVPSPTAPLDLNTATLEQLDALPGIGPTTAQKILDYRQAR